MIGGAGRGSAAMTIRMHGEASAPASRRRRPQGCLTRGTMRHTDRGITAGGVSMGDNAETRDGVTPLDRAQMMLTRAKVARLADVSERRVDYWASTGLLSTTVDEKIAGGQRVRLLDFTDAMTVLVLAQLRERVSLQHIRQIVSYLRNLEFQVTEVRFAIAGTQ